MGESMQRWIIHVDMDAFFAAVEQRDNPMLRGKPVIVGGLGGEVLFPPLRMKHVALGFNLRCRWLRHDGVVLKASIYQEIIVSIARWRVKYSVFWRNFSPVIEPLSLDEAFLDVTGMEWIYSNPADMACQNQGTDQTGNRPHCFGRSGPQ